MAARVLTHPGRAETVSTRLVTVLKPLGPFERSFGMSTVQLCRASVKPSPSLVDPAGGDLILLADLPNVAPRLIGKTICKSTARKWASSGIRGEKLQTRLLGGLRYTSERAVRAFLDRLAEL